MMRLFSADATLLVKENYTFFDREIIASILIIKKLPSKVYINVDKNQQFLTTYPLL